jgi:hypothetical protein
MSILEWFTKIHQTVLYKMFVEYGQTERGTDILNRISQFHYAITNCAAHLQTIEISGTLTDTLADITLLYCPVNTVIHAVHWLTQMFQYRKLRIWITGWRSDILNYIYTITVITFYYVTVTIFLSIAIN